MFKLISVTNRQLCREPLADRLEKIVRAGADAVILREKDLPEAQYAALCRQVEGPCGEALILHSYPGTARALQLPRLHLPLPVLRTLPQAERAVFSALGASCHSRSDVLEAEQLGCTYVTLGHIFATDCKKGLPPRGLEFLEQICRESTIPVYAIGGIGRENIRLTREAGASGACLMSGLMTCADPEAVICDLRKILSEGE